MAEYKLSNEAKEDLIRIHQYGAKKYGIVQADKYFNSFFECFDNIAKRPFSFQEVNFINSEYRRCVCGSDKIYYKINNNTVEIIAIIGRQDLKNIVW